MHEETQPKKESGGDHRDSRRNFLRTALASAVVLVIAGVAAITKSLWSPPPAPPAQNTSSSSSPFPRVKIANMSDLAPNKPITFNYPLDNEPNILVKIGQKADGGVGPDGDVVAFSQICQHLGCVYAYQAPATSPSCDSSYQATSPVGYCCCHGTIYDFLKGAKVTAGPSPRPQPQVTLEFDSSNGDIYAVGMSPPTVFGHNTGSNDVLYDLQGGTLVS